MLKQLALFIFASLLFWTHAVAAAPQRPNFVFIYADDWRWDALGVVQKEQGKLARFPWLQTPRLDQLAAQSVRFRNSFVVNSLCSPGRACVLTGRYSHLNGVTDNKTPLPLEADNVAKQLKQAGYSTAYCGKWHLDSQQKRPGFDYVASFVGQGKYNDCPILLNGVKTPTKGWIDDVSTHYAVEFLQKQPKDKPFFLFLGFKSPHDPRGGPNLPERVRDLYANDESRTVPNRNVQAVFRRDAKPNGVDAKPISPKQYEGHRAYMRHITAIDHCIGEVLDALDRNGQAERTIVIVTSDNGYYLGEHQLGDKRSAYEESMRVPLLVRVPGQHAKPGSTNDDMVLNIDHGATMLDYAGAKPLAEGQGRSLRPLLESQAPADWRKAFFYEYFKEEPFASPTVLAVRTERHKLITYPGHDEWTELYDLQSDPYEIRNLISNAALRSQLQKTFDEQAKAVAFKMP
jgi:arylsulfatase A-like enzyme